jgi:hypothetical protein
MNSRKNRLWMALAVLLFPLSLLAQQPDEPTLLSRLTGTWIGQCRYQQGWFIPTVTFDPANHRMTYKRIVHGVNHYGCINPNPQVEDAGAGEFYRISEQAPKLLVRWNPRPNQWTIEEFIFSAENELFWSQAASFRSTPEGMEASGAPNYYPGPMKRVQP